jgi:uncharacterized protein (TIGR02118 family)
MARMVVVYNQPKNPQAFDQHYFEIHLPLAKKIPGLRKYEVSKGPVISPTGHTAYLVAILYFDDMAAMKAGFSSPEGQACGEDRLKYATNDEVQMFLFDCKEI